MQALPRDKSLCLEISRDSEILKIGIRESDASISSYYEVPVPISEIEAGCQDMIAEINRAGRNGNKHSYREIGHIGQMLYDRLLPYRIKEQLAHTDAEYLLLYLDDQVVHLPWELLNTEHGFLCERFSMGRMTKTRQQFPEPRKRILSYPLKMWIIANPRCDLANADSECLTICDIMDRNSAAAEAESSVLSDDIFKKIRDYDLVHFAGHADFDVNAPEQNGWRISDGNFNAEDVGKMMGGAPMPSLVFSNACQSARTQAWTGKNIENSPFGLANAFMLAGVKHYIGTSWDVTDEPSSRFAQTFYEYLTSGMSIGEAVKHTRKTMSVSHDISWASYVLYGNPKDRYFQQQEQTVSVNAAPVIPMKPEVPDETRSLKGAEAAIEEAFIPPRQESSVKSRKHLAVIAGIILMILLISAALVYYSKISSKDEWTSTLMSIAVVVGIQTADTDKISAATESGLKNYRRIRLVNRMEIEIIKRELDLWESRYIDPAHKPKPGLLPAMLILHLKTIREDDSRNFVLMRLLNTQDGTIKEIFTEKLATPVSVSEQKSWADEHVVRKLRELYPLRGLVSEIGNEGIRLNIGSDVGVDLNQQFKIVGKDTILEVVSVKADSCITKVKSGSSIVSENSKVEAF